MEYIWVLSCLVITKQQTDTCTLCLVEPCGQGKMYFHMTDGYVGPSTGSLASVFHNLARNKNWVPALWWAVRLFCNGCQLACSGYTHGVEGGLPQHKWTPETSWRVEVWRTSVLGMACVSVFSVCLWGHLYANAKQPIGVANYSRAFVCAWQWEAGSF